MSRPVRAGVLGGGSRGSTVASLVAANATPDETVARSLQRVFAGRNFRVYTIHGVA